jgi:hypothetical protein
MAGILGLACFIGLGAVGAATIWRLAGAGYDALTVPTHVAPGLNPRLSGADAYRITVDYLNAMRSELAAPNLHQDPTLEGIWAVTADQAAGIDGCIPAGKGSSIVWVTKGTGDYLNLVDHPWSSASSGDAAPGVRACAMPGTAGTIVIDDATGQILGVYPDSGPTEPRPSPLVPAPSF